MIHFNQTREIRDYKTVIDTLIPDFDYVFLHTLLQWCRIAKDPYDKTGQFWQLWQVRYRFSVIGICGLYSLKPESTEELWLGWLGLVPKWRNRGHGKVIMEFLYIKAKEQECKKILSYVDKEGKPLNFYKREGFEIIGTVREYLEQNKMNQIDGSDFENMDDFVIQKTLNY